MRASSTTSTNSTMSATVLFLFALASSLHTTFHVLVKFSHHVACRIVITTTICVFQ